jgi:hypothetical protein
MATPTNREEFKDYCLRKLGHPVIEINIDEMQMEDRIDDALRFWQEYHFDGTERVLLAHKVTQNDIDKKYLTLTDNQNNSIIGINRLVGSSDQTSNMFSVKYQMALNDSATYSSIGSIGMSDYFFRMTNLEMVDDLLNGMSALRFNRKTNKVYIDWNWASDTVKDNYIVMEAYQIVDGTSYSEVWGDSFLKTFATALIKEQWGMNLSKFEGVQLPGGVTLNGRAILDDAKAEIERLKEQMSLQYELPIDFAVG